MRYAAYKSYVSAFVGLFVDEPGILGWELANEPSTGFLTKDCTTATNTTWVEEILAYIKSIDSNHLVGWATRNPTTSLVRRTGLMQVVKE
ncbi:hypothetical protein SCP_0309160 [Sparassis crispa]|uniref:mannan endo-1,4-beta-mannosidase n=1 Tax=Sparassis crispa TaxID=139825 RepID=A0A401GG95_9APHY|nr:hypothetical protein SCP_0309160 [Sparassis crispa]GBE81189.1 hypothetical protein SCP_0309160 [Sparassis crispa]